MRSSEICLGLAGYPLDHSLSPKIHMVAMTSCGLQGEYLLFPVKPEDTRSLNNLITRVRKKEIRGLNVTIPHKQTIIPMLDELTPAAKAIGAVNTVYLLNNKLVGDNTDAAGFLTDLKRMTRFNTSKEKTCALIFGAGGSARAVVHALVREGWMVTVAARSIDQARELALKFKGIKIMDINDRAAHSLNPRLIVNTTPLGMSPHIDLSPWPDLPLPPQAIIYDLVYNPRETKLVRDARAQGLTAYSGLGMLIEQAALAFEIWTGHSPSRSTLFEAMYL